MGKMKKYEPGIAKPPEDVSLSGNELAWDIIKSLAVYDGKPASLAFPGLDSIINTASTNYPWERLDFLARYFEFVDWRKWWRSLSGPMPGLQWDTNFQDVLVYQLLQKPFTVVVVWKKEWYEDNKYLRWFYYRLMWHLWWRKVDPTKDAKLRAILEGAVALDALAGREP